MKEVVLQIGFFVLVAITTGLHEKWRILDDRTPSVGDATDLMIKRKWHFYKGLLQLEFAFYILWQQHSVLAMLSFMSLFTLIHDIYINVTVLNKPFDYVGTTASFDKLMIKLFVTNRNVFIFKVLLTLVILFLYIKTNL
jgi:hypothetical protein